jgi:PAS domain S-box-containing protein
MTKNGLVTKFEFHSLFFMPLFAVAVVTLWPFIARPSEGYGLSSQFRAAKRQIRPPQVRSVQTIEQRSAGRNLAPPHGASLAEATKDRAVAQTSISGFLFLRSELLLRLHARQLAIYALCAVEAILIIVLWRRRTPGADADVVSTPQTDPANERSELLSSLVNSAMDAIIVVNSTRQIVLFNASAERFFGCAASQAIGSSIERFIPQRFRVAYRTSVPGITAGNSTNSTTAPVGALWGIRANGEEFPIETSIAEVKSRGQMLTALTIRDITDRLQVEQAVRDSEERFRLVTNAAPMLVWMAGTDKLCTYFNKAWLAFTGKSMNSELGNGWTSGIHSDDLQRCIDVYAQAFDQRAEFRTEFRLLRYDGEYRWIVNIGIPRFTPDGSFAGYIGSCVDVTERKRAESDRLKMLEEIAHLNRVASMGQMAASLAHELAQPLAAILSNAQAAARFASRPDPDLGEIQGALADITEDDERARSFVQNMRSMFQKQTIARTQFDLNKVIYNVTRLVRNDAILRGIQLRIALSPDPITVAGDAIVLQQVILNLASNGMDALQLAPQGQKILTLTTLVRPESDFGTVLVEDNGCGVADEDRHRLFTPFFTTKKDGLGMGLSICRSLIESLDGRIALLERTEPGATFEVELPLGAKHSLENSHESQLEPTSIGHY